MTHPFKTLLLAGALAVGGAAAAGAATLSIDGGVGGVLPNYFDPLPSGGAYGPGDAITIFDGESAGGLKVDTESMATVTVVGYEAGFKNEYIFSALGSLFNKLDVGESLTGWIASGFVPFSFKTYGTDPNAEIANGGSRTLGSEVRFALSAIFNEGKSVYAYFDDSGAGNDSDFDDMVVRIDVAPVPLPAGGVLLLTALGGLAAARRRKTA